MSVTGYHPSLCGYDYHLAEAGIRFRAEVSDELDAIHEVLADGEPAF